MRRWPEVHEDARAGRLRAEVDGGACGVAGADGLRGVPRDGWRGARVARGYRGPSRRRRRLIGGRETKAEEEGGRTGVGRPRWRRTQRGGVGKPEEVAAYSKRPDQRETKP